MKNHQAIKAFLLTLLFAAATPGWAILIQAGNNPQIDENVLFNEPGLLDSGTLVQGITNNTGYSVDFTGTESLTTPSGGQARIEAEDGGYTSLEIALNEAGATFTSLILNIDLANITGNGDGTIEFTVEQLGGPDLVQSFSAGESGQNFFTITAGIGESITRVSLLSTLQVRNIADISQIRIGGATSAENPIIPEPASMSLLGLGLGSLAWIRGRRSRG